MSPSLLLAKDPLMVLASEAKDWNGVKLKIDIVNVYFFKGGTNNFFLKIFFWEDGHNVNSIPTNTVRSERNGFWRLRMADEFFCAWEES